MNELCIQSKAKQDDLLRKANAEKQSYNELLKNNLKSERQIRNVR